MLFAPPLEPERMTTSSVVLQDSGDNKRGVRHLAHWQGKAVQMCGGHCSLLPVLRASQVIGSLSK